MDNTITTILLIVAVLLPFGCAAHFEMKEDARYKAEMNTTRDWRE